MKPDITVEPGTGHLAKRERKPTMNATTQEAPKCPGCHFGCSLDRYQCARGKGLHAKWLAGEEIPERRAPWERAKRGEGPRKAGIAGSGPEAVRGQTGAAAEQRKGPEGHRDHAGMPPIPSYMKAMRMLNIASFALADHRESQSDKMVVDAIARQEGCATLPIIKDRMGKEALDPAACLDQLVQDGLVEVQEDEIAGTMYALTERGRAQSETWRDERMAADAAFVDALSEGEQEKLAALIAKMLQSSAHKSRMR